MIGSLQQSTNLSCMFTHAPKSNQMGLKNLTQFPIPISLMLLFDLESIDHRHRMLTDWTFNIFDSVKVQFMTKYLSTKLVKPVVVFRIDSGPDENPRCAKVIKIAIHHLLTNDWMSY